MREIFERKSVRDYTPEPIDQTTAESLLKAAMQAPSANNQQAWEFVVVSDKGRLAELSACSPYAAPLKRAAMAIVVLGNEDFMISEKYWQQDLAAATQNILLEAEHLGLGAVWLGIAPDGKRMQMVSDVLLLSGKIRPFSIVSLGHPMEKGKAECRYLRERCHFEQYGKKEVP